MLDRIKSSTKSVDRLFEPGPYPLLISLKARGLCGEKDERDGIKKEPIMEGRSCPRRELKPARGVKPGEQKLPK